MKRLDFCLTNFSSVYYVEKVEGTIYRQHWVQQTFGEKPLLPPFTITFVMEKFPAGANSWGCIVGFSHNPYRFDEPPTTPWNSDKNIYGVTVLSGLFINLTHQGVEFLKTNSNNYIKTTKEMFSEITIKLKPNYCMLVSNPYEAQASKRNKW